MPLRARWRSAAQIVHRGGAGEAGNCDATGAHRLIMPELSTAPHWRRLCDAAVGRCRDLTGVGDVGDLGPDAGKAPDMAPRPFATGSPAGEVERR